MACRLQIQAVFSLLCHYANDVTSPLMSLKLSTFTIPDFLAEKIDPTLTLTRYTLCVKTRGFIESCVHYYFLASSFYAEISQTYLLTRINMRVI